MKIRDNKPLVFPQQWGTNNTLARANAKAKEKNIHISVSRLVFSKSCSPCIKQSICLA